MTKARPSVKASSANTVTVACKVPNGLMLQNFKFVEMPEPIQGGGSKMVKRSVPDGDAIPVHGPGRYHGQAPKTPIVMGFALTKGVPIEHWDRWLEANKDSAIVKNSLIFANPDVDDVRAEAQDHKAAFSGLERMNPKGDYRNPKRNGMDVETAKESAQPKPENEEHIEED